jgi:small subunit ribosomal protein S21
LLPCGTAAGEVGEFLTMATITVDDNENLEKAIKRFKRMVEKEGIIREYKKREFYEKPSTILNRKNKTLQRKLMKKNHKPRETTKTAY